MFVNIRFLIYSKLIIIIEILLKITKKKNYFLMNNFFIKLIIKQVNSLYSEIEYKNCTNSYNSKQQKVIQILKKKSGFVKNRVLRKIESSSKYTSPTHLYIFNVKRMNMFKKCKCFLVMGTNLTVGN